MRELKTKGLVTRASELGDNDNLVLLLTPEHGKLYVAGKGTRSLKNKNHASVSEFVYGEFVLFSRGGKSFYISEFEPIETFYNLRDDIEKLALAVYITDAAAALMPEENGDAELFRLTLNMLYAAANLDISLWQIKGAFEFRAAAIAGFAPMLESCGECGADKCDKLYLDVMNGCVLCSDCRYKKERLDEAAAVPVSRIYLYLSPLVHTALRYTLVAPQGRLLKFSLDGRELDAYCEITEKYFLNHMERGFQTLKFFHDITDRCPI